MGVKTRLGGSEFYTLCPPFFSQIIMSIIIDIKSVYVHNYKHYYIITKWRLLLKGKKKNTIVITTVPFIHIIVGYLKFQKW